MEGGFCRKDVKVSVKGTWGEGGFCGKHMGDSVKGTWGRDVSVRSILGDCKRYMGMEIYVRSM